MREFDQDKFTLIKTKGAGKNASAFDGFYLIRGENGREDENVFIKKPPDSCELFTEWFAGRFINQLIKPEIIHPTLAKSFITADMIKFPDGSYGLIQPTVEFTELFRLIGTGTLDDHDRSAWWETLFGPGHYEKIKDQFSAPRGLAETLFISLWLGDYSVHSGNMVVLNARNSEQAQFARIDWGAAFRNFGHPQNSKDNPDITIPYEVTGWFNYRWFSKQYFYNYHQIHGLYPAVAGYGNQIADKIHSKLLQNIVLAILDEMPEDCLEAEDYDKLAAYMDLATFAHLKESTLQSRIQFAHEFFTVLTTRLEKITKLGAQTVATNDEKKDSTDKESARSQMKPISSELIEKKLKKLDEFYKSSKVRLKSGRALIELENFYEAARDVIKDERRDVDKGQKLADLAHLHFHHRHKLPRLLADALLIIAGLVIGVSGVVNGHRFFISQAPTTREIDAAALASSLNP